jgi:hypothetical protein
MPFHSPSSGKFDTYVREDMFIKQRIRAETSRRVEWEVKWETVRSMKTEN